MYFSVQTGQAHLRSPGKNPNRANEDKGNGSGGPLSLFGCRTQTNNNKGRTLQNERGTEGWDQYFNSSQFDTIVTVMTHQKWRRALSATSLIAFFPFFVDELAEHIVRCIAHLKHTGTRTTTTTTKKEKRWRSKVLWEEDALPRDVTLQIGRHPGQPGIRGLIPEIATFGFYPSFDWDRRTQRTGLGKGDCHHNLLRKYPKKKIMWPTDSTKKYPGDEEEGQDRCGWWISVCENE